METFPVDLEFSVAELGVDHDLGSCQINDRLKVVRHFVFSNKYRGSTSNAENLLEDPLLFFKSGRRKVRHGFL